MGFTSVKIFIAKAVNVTFYIYIMTKLRKEKLTSEQTSDIVDGWKLKTTTDLKLLDHVHRLHPSEAGSLAPAHSSTSPSMSFKVDFD